MPASDPAALLARGERLLGKIGALRDEAHATTILIEDAQEQAAVYEQAAALLRSYSTEAAEKLRSDIEKLVTYGVQSVFGDESLSFKVTNRVLRGVQVVEFALVSNGVERPVLGSHGGGVAEVVGFILRVVVVLLSSRRPFLVLDEPFARVSVNYRPRLAQFVAELVERTSLQLLIVTHDADLPEVADRHYRLTLREGKTEVQLVPRDTEEESLA
jgi:DNA repair ATPase RecN